MEDCAKADADVGVPRQIERVLRGSSYGQRSQMSVQEDKD
jgi:hypothetical protein